MLLRWTLALGAAALAFGSTAHASPLICLDPGHARQPNLGTEPIGPGSAVRKIKDGGGAAGEARVVMQIARKTRTRLRRHGYRVAMTRTGPVFDRGNGGNIARARFCNRRHAALMLRIHADGSTDPSVHGASTLFPALHRGWTDDVYRPSRRAARIVQRALIAATGAQDRGLVARRDITGFNWANVPVILTETGFMTNPREGARLRSRSFQRRVARGLVRGVVGFTPPR